MVTFFTSPDNEMNFFCLLFTATNGLSNVPADEWEVWT